MGKSLLEKRMILLLFFMLISSGLTFASEGDIYKGQGLIMNIDAKINMMIVNERQFVWNQNTIVNNEKGSPVQMDKFKAKAWVYIEGVKDKNNNRIIIEKIYLLPKYVDKNERHLYPFMQ
jgi:hypothetical protein